jgi:hypothetical protein
LHLVPPAVRLALDREFHHPLKFSAAFIAVTNELNIIYNFGFLRQSHAQTCVHILTCDFHAVALHWAQDS